LAQVLQKPVRLLNDAEVQGYGVIAGRGLELVLTLGTGAGTALFRDGKLMPHMELAQHPIRGKTTYDDYVGARALKRKGKRKRNRRVHRTIKILLRLFSYDVLYIGGGNSQAIKLPPCGAFIVDNTAGITGGVRLWEVADITAQEVATSLDYGPNAASTSKRKRTV